MPHFFDRLHEAMEILVEFFALDGSGLAGRKLYTEQYHEVEMFFNLNKVSTWPKWARSRVQIPT